MSGALGSFGVTAALGSAAGVIKNVGSTRNILNISGAPKNIPGTNVKPGEFSIVDWKGYPSGVPKPTGPARLINGEEYEVARKAADSMNGKLRRAFGLKNVEVDVHEIKPVRFGGSPTDLTNKVALPRDLHEQVVTPWWNQLMRAVK